MSLLTNLIAYWKLDEASGNAADATGNGWTLTNNNTVTYATGKINNGADGGASNTNKFLSQASSLGLDNSSSMSLSFWTYITTAPSGSTENFYFWQKQTSTAATDFFSLIGYQDVAGTKTIQCAATVGSGSYTTTLTIGNWYHFVLTITNNGSTNPAIVYLNGSSIITFNSGTGTGGTSPSVFNLLHRRISGENPLSGMMDEVGVWSRALSSAEVLQLYNGGKGLQYPFINIIISDTSGIPVDTVNMNPFANIVRSDTSGVPIESKSVKYGLVNNSKHSATWTNRPKS